MALADRITWALYEADLRTYLGVATGEAFQLQLWLESAVECADHYLGSDLFEDLDDELDDVAQVDTLTYTGGPLTGDAEFEILIDGELFAYSGSSGETAAQVAAAVALVINADPAYTATDNGSGVVTITGKPGVAFVTAEQVTEELSLSIATVTESETRLPIPQQVFLGVYEWVRVVRNIKNANNASGASNATVGPLTTVKTGDNSITYDRPGVLEWTSGSARTNADRAAREHWCKLRGSSDHSPSLLLGF